MAAVDDQSRGNPGLISRRGVPRPTRALLLAGLLAGALVVAAGPADVPGLAPPAARAADECQTAWTQSPSAWHGVSMTGAAALAGQPAWAVGYHTWDGSRDLGFWRWNGGGWDSTPSPWGPGGLLNAVNAVNANVAWAVGESREQPRVARWNGSQWLNITPPTLAGSMATFTDVAGVSAKIAWMTGARLAGGRLKPVVVQRKRTAWKDFSPSVPTATEAGLTAASRAPGGRIWVGGWRADAGSQSRPWLLYRNGSSWQTVATASVPNGRAALTSLVFRQANDGWLAGFVETAGSGYQPILQHWNGTSWTSQPTPWTAADSVLLHGVAVDGLGHVTVVGTRLRDSGRHGMVATYDGSAWRTTDLAPAGEGWMMNAAGLERGSLVVGMHNTRGAALLTCAATAVANPYSRPAMADRRLAALARHAHPEDSHADLGGRSTAEPQLPHRVAIADYEALDVTSDAGLAMTVRTWSAVPADFNDDGYVDIYLNRHTETEPELWLGSESGTFTKSAAAFSFEDRHDCEAADVNDDGVLDLFCTMGANSGNSTWPHELLLGPLEAGGTDATADWGLLDAFGRGREAVFLNLDGDEYPDLFLTNEPERSDGMPSSNRLYRNVGGTHFVPAPEWGVDRSLSGVCATAADIDGDGDDDLLICPRFKADKVVAGIRLLINDGSRFVDRTKALGLVPRDELDVEVADLNGDGRLDIASVRAGALRIHHQQANGSFTLAASITASNGVSVAVGDVNGDGVPDLWLSRRSAADLMLVNDGSGATFTTMDIPQPTGSTDDVIALDYDGNGLTDFLSLNGGGPIAGPLMLIGFFETVVE